MTDRLEIINHMLNTVGEAGVVTIESLHPSVTVAKRILSTTDKTFQLRGWWFNKEYGITLEKNIANEVDIPANAIEFTIDQNRLQYLSSGGKLQYVQRGTKVYDALNHTFNISRSIPADLVLQLDIEDLPGAASNYLLHKAAEAMYLDDDGDEQKLNRLNQRVAEAWNQLKAAELKALNTSSLDAPMARALQFGIGQYGSPSNPNFPGGRFR